MLIFIRKRNLLLLLCVVLLSVLTLGLVLRTGMTESVSAKTVTGQCIVVDAGHGEPDGGAVGTKGVAEQQINLNIAKELEKMLSAKGFRVVMTRTEAQGIYDEGLSTVREKKRSDLHNREALMNSVGADLFVSIHLNKFTDGKYSGPQVFYSANREESALAAQWIQNAMNEKLAPPSPREIKKAGNDIYLLRQAKIPAVLVECGFLSNPREEELLLDGGYQKKVATAISEGLVQYIKGAK